MSTDNEDDKPTVVIDINALKKQKQNQEEELASLASELEFNVGVDDAPNCSVVLLDLESDFFEKSLSVFPKSFQYKVVKSVAELSASLKNKQFQIVVLNYDSNPKAINALSAQIKKKFTWAKTIIMAKGLSEQKAQVHAKSAYGAHGYGKFPIDSELVEKEFLKIIEDSRKAS